MYAGFCLAFCGRKCPEMKVPASSIDYLIREAPGYANRESARKRPESVKCTAGCWPQPKCECKILYYYTPHENVMEDGMEVVSR